MKKIFPDAPDVPQGVANRGVRIIEKHLRMHKVDRVKDLPEEAKVRLLRDLRSFFDAEMGQGGAKGGASSHGFWADLWEKIENFLSFSAVSMDSLVVQNVIISEN
jgi:hypothetical protein